MSGYTDAYQKSGKLIEELDHACSREARLGIEDIDENEYWTNYSRLYSLSILEVCDEIIGIPV
jgi:hypothetical protein